MRPPDHWRAHRRRSYGLLWAAIFLVGTVVLAALVVRPFSGGGSNDVADRTQESVVAASTCALDTGCAPPTTPECPSGAECAGDSGLALPSNDFVVASEFPPPQISGQSAVVLEESCSAILYGLRAHERFPPASLTKIITALVAVEQAELSELVDVRVNSALLVASTSSSVMGLEPGQQLSMRDLLYGLLLPSGNDAAIAIAEYVGGTLPAFVSLMNGKVQGLGLQDTRAANPHGLDEAGLYTSAYDIAILGRELLAQPELAEIVSTETYQPRWDGPPVWNGNQWLYEYPGALGVKTGSTVKAGQTLVAAAERDGRTVIVAILSSGDRDYDATVLLDWAFASTTSPCFG